PMTFGKKEEQIFLGRDFTQAADYSESTAIEIDNELRRFLQEAYHRAKGLLKHNLEILHKMAEALLERESLDGSEIDTIIRTWGGGNGLNVGAASAGGGSGPRRPWPHPPADGAHRGHGHPQRHPGLVLRRRSPRGARGRARARTAPSRRGRGPDRRR